MSIVGEPSVFWVGCCGSGVGVVAGASSPSARPPTLPSSDSAFGSSVLGSVWFGSSPLRCFLFEPLSPRAGVEEGAGVDVAPGVGEGSRPTCGVLVGDGVRVWVGVAVCVGLAVCVGVGVGVSTGPRSVILSTGAGRFGIVDRLDRLALRDVDREGELLAVGQAHGDAVQLRGRGHAEEAEHGGRGERDDQLPTSHRWCCCFPSPAATARDAALLPRRYGRTVATGLWVSQFSNA